MTKINVYQVESWLFGGEIRELSGEILWAVDNDRIH